MKAFFCSVVFLFSFFTFASAAMKENEKGVSPDDNRRSDILFAKNDKEKELCHESTPNDKVIQKRMEIIRGKKKGSKQTDEVREKKRSLKEEIAEYEALEKRQEELLKKALKRRESEKKIVDAEIPSAKDLQKTKEVVVEIQLPSRNYPGKFGVLRKKVRVPIDADDFDIKQAIARYRSRCLQEGRFIEDHPSLNEPHDATGEDYDFLRKSKGYSFPREEESKSRDWFSIPRIETWDTRQ